MPTTRTPVIPSLPSLRKLRRRRARAFLRVMRRKPLARMRAASTVMMVGMLFFIWALQPSRGYWWADLGSLLSWLCVGMTWYFNGLTRGFRAGADQTGRIWKAAFREANAHPNPVDPSTPRRIWLN